MTLEVKKKTIYLNWIAVRAYDDGKMRSVLPFHYANDNAIKFNEKKYFNYIADDSFRCIYFLSVFAVFVFIELNRIFIHIRGDAFIILTECG